MCSEIQPRLMDYAWQRLTAADAGAIEHHLSGCAVCRKTLEEERALGTMLANVPTVAPSRDMWDAVRLRKMAFDIPMPSHPLVSRSHPSIRGWTTAVAVGMAAVALMMAPGRPSKQAPSSARVLAQTIDSVTQVTRQSDDPLGDISDSTWDALSLPETPS